MINFSSHDSINVSSPRRGGGCTWLRVRTSAHAALPLIGKFPVEWRHHIELGDLGLSPNQAL